jgi:hypothetical protein
VIDLIEQPIPDVTEDDVERVARRDFGDAQLVHVLAALDEHDRQWDGAPSARIRLAILKVAAGDRSRLRESVQDAIEDYRDVLAAAEYPRYSREIGFDDAPDALRRKVIYADWAQYCMWLGREPTPA